MAHSKPDPNKDRKAEGERKSLVVRQPGPDEIIEMDTQEYWIRVVLDIRCRFFDENDHLTDMGRRIPIH